MKTYFAKGRTFGRDGDNTVKAEVKVDDNTPLKFVAGLLGDEMWGRTGDAQTEYNEYSALTDEQKKKDFRSDYGGTFWYVKKFEDGWIVEAEEYWMGIGLTKKAAAAGFNKLAVKEANRT